MLHYREPGCGWNKLRGQQHQSREHSCVERSKSLRVQPRLTVKYLHFVFLKKVSLLK